MKNYPTIQIVGGGLAGCEAALQLAQAGFPVRLFEMRPEKRTPAHKTGNLAELVCSNSFKGTDLHSAHGLFKEELKRLGSVLMAAAEVSRVTAGQSLAVDREAFSREVERRIAAQPGISVERREALEIDPDTYMLIASGPLTSEGLCARLGALTGTDRLFFFDSIAPVVEADSIDRAHAYLKNRWDKGASKDFINCPMDRNQYGQFVEALRNADTVEQKPFEKKDLFEGCLPIEEMARRGEETLRFGPMRPIGLEHPETDVRPWAVIQLRPENSQGTLYNLVGCQTRLRQGTQKAVFSLVPALKNAVFARFGAMHRNTFIDSPSLLERGLRLRGTRIFFAGQITGAEGYTEAAATGLYAASMIAADFAGLHDFDWPAESCTGALVRHLLAPNPEFQPMNFNFGLFPPLAERHSKADKKKIRARICLKALEGFRLPWH